MRVVLQVLIQRQREFHLAISFGRINTGKRKAVCVMPVISVQFDKGQVGHGINSTFKHAQSFIAPSLLGYGKREVLITSGDISGKCGLGEGSPQCTIARRVAFKADKHAVVALSVLIELTVFDTVIDNFRVNATAGQIRKNTPVISVSGWQLEWLRLMFCYRRGVLPVTSRGRSDDLRHSVWEGKAAH